MRPQVQQFFDELTNTFSYVLCDAETRKAAISDSVLDYDHKAGTTSTESPDKIVDFVNANRLSIDWILETHAHADHLTAAPYLQQMLGGKVAIGEGIRRVQTTFKEIFNLKDLNTTGIQFDHLFRHEETFRIGTLEGRVLSTPGHTSDSVTYVIGDAAFVGDTLFAPDYGTARTDFPGGDAGELYRSIRRLFELPEDTRVFLCHDYPPNGRAPQHVHALREQRTENVHVRDGIVEAAFVTMREARDATLPMPNLIIPSVQVNIRAGHMPPAEDNGTVYLKVPINVLGAKPR
jgi:glyoxylase-like metal-dependent hydrolase (beta-lactamase superfamily II)